MKQKSWRKQYKQYKIIELDILWAVTWKMPAIEIPMEEKPPKKKKLNMVTIVSNLLASDHHNPQGCATDIKEEKGSIEVT